MPDSRLKVGVLFNHDALHQVAHIAPVITALRDLYPAIHITALASSTAQLTAVQNIVGRPCDDGFKVELLGAPRLTDCVLDALSHVAPFRRLYILKKYRDLFGHYDCLLVPEMTSTRLKTRYGLRRTRLVLLPHGAGDRSIGFSPEVKHFDHVLLSGPKVRDRMLAAGIIRPDNFSVVGYPKFDAVGLQKPTPIFPNDRPTVLYNPHFEPRLSSWYTMGLDVLAYFANHPRFNLVVAPHVMLFRKRVHFSLESGHFRWVKNIPAKYWDTPNIHIDLGSERSVNMHYTVNADIYLGDASSQVYEFLRRPRPCIFLNSHGAAWGGEENYRHWNFGPVLTSVPQLDAPLRHLDCVHDDYRARQIAGFAETFDLGPTASSTRAASAIVKLLGADTLPTPHARPTVRWPTRAPARLAQV